MTLRSKDRPSGLVPMSLALRLPVRRAGSGTRKGRFPSRGGEAPLRKQLRQHAAVFRSARVPAGRETVGGTHANNRIAGVTVSHGGVVLDLGVLIARRRVGERHGGGGRNRSRNGRSPRRSEWSIGRRARLVDEQPQFFEFGE